MHLRSLLLPAAGLILLAGPLPGAAENFELVAPPDPVTQAPARNAPLLVAPEDPQGTAAGPSLVAPETVAKPASEPASAGVSAPQTLADGTIEIAPLWLAAEALQDQEATDQRYARKVMQFAGELHSKTMSNGEVSLTIHAAVPGIGQKDLWCTAGDAVSMQAAAALKRGSAVTLAGIYQPDYFAGMNRKAVEELATNSPKAEGMGTVPLTGSLWTLRFERCLVLTGHPDPEGARALLVKDAVKLAE